MGQYLSQFLASLPSGNQCFNSTVKVLQQEQKLGTRTAQIFCERNNVEQIRPLLNFFICQVGWELTNKTHSSCSKKNNKLFILSQCEWSWPGNMHSCCPKWHIPSWKWLHDFLLLSPNKTSHKSMNLPTILAMELGRWLMAKQGHLSVGSECLALGLVEASSWLS